MTWHKAGWLAENIARAVAATIERECLGHEGDWRLGPVEVTFNAEKAVEIIRAAMEACDCPEAR